MSEGIPLPPLPVWSAHWPSERLKQEAAAAPRAFARGFRLQAFTDEERAFPSFTSCYAPGLRIEDIVRRGYPTFIGVDLAGDKRPGNVIFAAAMDPVSHHRYPLEVMAGGWKSPETARKLHEIHGRHPNTRFILVESNGYQQSLVDWIRQTGGGTWWYKVESFTTGANKANPTIGLPSMELEFHHKMWSIPTAEYKHHPVTCPCGWCTWDQEMHDYPMSPTTDCVMAMWFCREAIARWGFGAGGALPTVPSNVR
jgi:hypothetical protein